MKPAWSNLYDRVRDRRNGLLFAGSLLGFVGLCFFAAVCVKELHESSVETRCTAGLALALLLAAAGAWCLLEVCRLFPRKAGGTICERLSSDELRKARSKLLSRRNGKGV